MVGIFDSQTEIAEAKIFFGSTEDNKKEQQERKSPFDGSVVSTAPLCNALKLQLTWQEKHLCLSVSCGLKMWQKH